MIYWWEEKRKAEGQNDPGFIRQSFTMNLLLLGRTLNPMGDTKMKKKRKENMAPSKITVVHYRPIIAEYSMCLTNLQ